MDNSARVQTVGPANNPRLVDLLEAFYALTGCPVLLNTSFNLRGDPIVCTPEDAIASFPRSGLDLVVLGNVVLRRTDLPGGYVEGVEDFSRLVGLARLVSVSHDAYTLI